jgi:hypothetical protein
MSYCSSHGLVPLLDWEFGKTYCYLELDGMYTSDAIALHALRADKNEMYSVEASMQSCPIA